MRRHLWALGEHVQVQYPDATVAGQVWEKAPGRTQIWLALDNGTFVLADTATGNVFAADPRSGKSKSEPVGRLAA